MSERRDLEQNILIQPSWKLSCDFIFAKLSAFQTWGFHLFASLVFPGLWLIENVTYNNKPGSGDDGWEQSQWRSKQIKSRWWPCDVSNNCGNLGKCQKGFELIWMHWRDFFGAKGAWEVFLLLQLGGRCGPDIRHCLRTAALLLLLKCNTHVAVQWNLATLNRRSALPCQVQPGNILSAFVAPGAMICFPGQW